MFSAKWRLIVGLVVIAGMVGCTKGDSGQAKTEKASGTVTYKGKPVEGATVTFVPDTADKPAAVARTDASGKFVLMTYDTGDGAVIGTYKVKIAKTSAPDPAAAAGAAPDDPDAAYAAMEKAGVDVMGGGTIDPSKMPKAKDLIPAKYGNADTSGLIANVTKGGKNEFTFNLED